MKQHISDRIKQAAYLIEPRQLGEDIWHILEEQHFTGLLPHFVINHLCQKHQLDNKQLALKLLPVAACYSHTPISHFHVGAVAIGISGNFYFGANQEFSDSNIQQTIHAEQSAISYAWINKEKSLTDIVVNHTPCGHCRQFMNELNSASELQIHLPHSQNNPLQKYLPDSFGPRNLDIELHLLDAHSNHLSYETDDPVILAALSAANMAHAPYSNSYHGVAIQTQNQQIFIGSYAENAAFNPSLPALQVAINNVFLNGEEIENIQRIVMIEQANALSYRKMSEDLIESICDIKLEYVSL
ncbi:cytidine deaminase [Pasteurella canis]|uniref:cytidine deaminase n=1 Tax=Pasteurella canis TaxID=753 RepID=UPI001D11A5F9|nr:cytidine deaminase [Pasteurella canis]UDW84132.1 cytidine deaminase [Pasteurella canis]